MLAKLKNLFSLITKPKTCKVILTNDDENGGEYVQEIISTMIPHADSYAVIMEAHNSGHSVLFEGTVDECKKIMAAIQAAGPDPSRENAANINVSLV